MGSREEKLSILSEMIAFARVDESIKDSEYQFLLGVAKNLGVDEDAFESLLNKKPTKALLKTQTERIVQFHRLLLLMNVDDEQHEKEMNLLRNIGLSMGLPPEGVERVLSIMHKYPKKVVPPKILLEIFRTHHN